MPTSVRLDLDTEKLLDRLARQRSQTKSDIIREAIYALAADDKAVSSRQTFYESIRDLVGCTESGVGNLSEQTGKRFRDLVLTKQKGTDAG